MTLSQSESTFVAQDADWPPASASLDRREACSTYHIRTVPACGGTLGFGACPGVRHGRFRADRLGQDLDRIAEWQPVAILCLLGEDEIEGLDLSRLSHEVRLRGVGWLQPDAPDGEDETMAQRDWQTIAPRLLAALANGGRLLLHGASGTERAVAAAERLLVENGATAAATRLHLKPASDGT